MSQKTIEINFGTLGIGIKHSPDGKVALPIEAVAEILGLPKASTREAVEQRIMSISEAEQMSFQHSFLRAARCAGAESVRRGRR